MVIAIFKPRFGCERGCAWQRSYEVVFIVICKASQGRTYMNNICCYKYYNNPFVYRRTQSPVCGARQWVRWRRRQRTSRRRRWGRCSRTHEVFTSPSDTLPRASAPARLGVSDGLLPQPGSRVAPCLVLTGGKVLFPMLVPTWFNNYISPLFGGAMSQSWTIEVSATLSNIPEDQLYGYLFTV
jgi:hypothetical protein